MAGSNYEGIICTIPADDTITAWLRDGTVLDINDNGRLSVLEIGGTGQFYRLVINNIQQSDSGHYQCRTSSSESLPSGNVNVIGKYLHLCLESVMQCVVHVVPRPVVKH